MADVDTAPTTIHQYMQLETVPHVFFFPAHEAPELPPNPAMRLSLEGGGDAILEELEERIGLVLTSIPDTETTVQVAVGFALGLALLLYLVLDRWEWAKSVVFSRRVWLAFSYLVFMTATGGMIYCLIRTPPPYGVYLQKVQLFMNRDSSDQFVAEGLVMGCIQLCSGLSFVSMYWFASQKRNGVVQWLGTYLPSFPSSLPLFPLLPQDMARVYSDAHPLRCSDPSFPPPLPPSLPPFPPKASISPSPLPSTFFIVSSRSMLLRRGGMTSILPSTRKYVARPPFFPPSLPPSLDPSLASSRTIKIKLSTHPSLPLSLSQSCTLLQLSTFLFGNMKKGSGLFRRVLRVTQLWLYEYKDWGVFRRMASSLMAKYVKKMTGR